MTCQHCNATDVRRLVIHDRELWCGPCHDATKGSERATAVIVDDIPGGFVQEHFGHQPEIFYSKKAMLKRASDLGLQPYVRHRDGDPHTKRWI